MHNEHKVCMQSKVYNLYDAKMLKYEIFCIKNYIWLQQFSVDAVCTETIPAWIGAEGIFFNWIILKGIISALTQYILREGLEL